MTRERQTAFAGGFAAFLSRAWFTVLVGAVAVAFAVGALGYTGDAQKFPLMVGVLTALLVAAELVLMGVGRSSDIQGSGADPSTGRLRSYMLAVWFAATVGALYVLGLLVAAFLSTAAYFFIFVDRKPLWAFVFGIAHCAFIWLAFDVLAGFRLYEGRVW